ncbi:iron ABC transporter substrate-binding protein [soil metagenome]
MRTFRQLLLLALMPLLAALTACSDDDSASGGSEPPVEGEAAECSAPGISTEDITDETPAETADPEPFEADPALDGESITLYSGRDLELIQPIIDRFSEVTGIDVEIRDGDSSEMAAQLLEEGDSTPADVFYSQEVGATGVLAKADLLSELPDEIIEQVDERFRPGSDNAWVGVTGRTRVIAYNPELVEERPDCVLALTDEQYRGDVAIVPSNAGFKAFMTGFRVQEGDDEARAWLEAMGANEAITEFESNGDVLDAVDAGDVPIGLINHYYWARSENRDTLNAQLVFPTGDDPGGLVNATAVGVMAGSADDPASLALVEYLLSAEGQTTFVEETYEYPVVDGVADPEGVPPLDELEGPALDLTDLDSLEETEAMLTDMGLLN